MLGLAGLGLLFPHLLDGDLSKVGSILFVIFLALLVLLLSTDFLDPLPIWRPIVVLIASLSIVLLMMNSLIVQNGPYTPTSKEDWGIITHKGRRVEEILLAVAIGLLVVGTIELRGVLRRLLKPGS